MHGVTPKPHGTKAEVDAWIAEREARRCACGGAPTDEPMGYHLASCTATYTGPKGSLA